VLAFAAYLVAGAQLAGQPLDVAASLEGVSPWGLLHLLSIGVVILTAVAGRHIIEAISWGLVLSAVLNVLLGWTGLVDVRVTDMVVFNAPETSGVASTLASALRCWSVDVPMPLRSNCEASSR
ncbi:Na+/H+ antiporter NhaC family protein, partial [Halobium palmae]